MATFYLYSFLLAAITLTTECALMFLKEPESPIYAVEGSDVDIKWVYSEVNKTIDLRSIIWRVQNKTTGQDLVLIVETVDGIVTVNPNVAAKYRNRVEKKEQATLVIKEVTSEDSTGFSCRLRSTQGTPFDATSRIQLVVTDRASVFPVAQCADVGSSITFTCNAKAVPSQNFTWIRQERIETVNHGGRFSIVSTLGSSQLIVKNVSVADRGYYACDATMSSLQQNEAVFYFQVPCSDPPKQDTTYCQETNYSLAVGDTEQICCPVSGYPPPFFTWKKDGVQLKGEDSVLTITISGEKDFGNYTCSATDFRTSSKSIYISIREKVGLSVKAIDGTLEKPAKLEIHPLLEAKKYVVEISGKEIKDDYVIGTKTSVELHYNTIVMKTGSEKPEEIEISVNVTAMSENECIDKTSKPLKLIIKRPSDTEY